MTNTVTNPIGPNVDPKSRSASPVAHVPNTAIQTDLASMSIWKLLFRYSGPAIIAYVCTSLYNIVDSIFIGHGVGPMALAALAVNLPLMNLVVAFCTLIAVGGSAMVSIYLGRKDMASATDTVNNVMLFCLIHSVVFGGIALIWLKPLLYLFGATDQTYPYAAEFMRVILYASPMTYVFLGLNNLLRATGYPTKAMISALLSVSVNLALAPILIFKLNAGIAGAAWATVLGQFAGFIWVLCHFLNKKSLVHLDIHQKWVSGPIIAKIYKIGTSPFIMNVCACVVVVFLNHALLQYGGTDGNYYVGAYGILNRVTMIFVMIVFGVSQGMQPILGYNWGARNWERVRQTFFKGLWLGTGVTVIGWILTQTCPDYLSKMFTTDDYLINIARKGFHIYFLIYPLVGAEIVIENFFQSIGKPLMSIILSTTRQLIFLLPFLLILPHFMGVTGIWASMAAADGASFTLAAIFAAVLLPRYAKEIKSKLTIN